MSDISTTFVLVPGAWQGGWSWQPVARRLFHELLVPQPGAYFLQALDVDGVTTLGLPAAYVLGENDLALARPGDELAARIGLTPLMVPGGHQSMLTHPDEVAEALLKC